MAKQFDNTLFRYSNDGSDNMANKGLQVIEIYHVPTDQSIKFKAMMTGFSDTFTSEWNEETVYGRMDPLMTYKRTGRKISMAFDLPAYSRGEAEKNVARVQALAQFLYPVFDENRLIKNSPLCKIQFMNWSSKFGRASTAKRGGLLGGINGFSYSPQLDAGVFGDIGGNPSIEPKLLNVSFDFTVIHEHVLGWQKSEQDGYNFAEYEDSYPWGRPARFVISPGPEDENAPAPVNEAQKHGVPNDEKDKATAKAMTQPGAGSDKSHLIKIGGKWKRVSKEKHDIVRDFQRETGLKWRD